MYERVLFTVAVLIGLGTVASADTLAGGPVYGGASSVGGTVTCRVFNAGQGSLSLTTREIVNNAGGVVTLSFDTCNVGISPAQSCEYGGPITGNFAFSCHMFETGVDGIVTGVVEIQSSGGTVLNTVPLKKF